MSNEIFGLSGSAVVDGAALRPTSSRATERSEGRPGPSEGIAEGTVFALTRDYAGRVLRWVPGLPSLRSVARDDAVAELEAIQCSFSQIEKLVPHPHDATAFGFLIWKDWPIRSSTKS